MRNLLDIPFLGSVLRSTWTWRFIRLGMLVLLLMMIGYGWSQHAVPGVDVRDPLMYTNLATYGLWVVWMMGMVAVAMIFGRSWCTVCPVGWLNGIVSRYGLRRELPSWLDHFVPITLMLVVLQLLVYVFAIHRYPDYSAVLLLWMLLLAILAGLWFKRRSFCMLLCPAGALFSLYARLAPFQLRVKDHAVCQECSEKPCIRTDGYRRQAALAGYHVQWQCRPEGCPVNLVPAHLEDSAECALCMNCVHTCCNDNIRLGFRGWPADLLQNGLRTGETLFFVALLGLLTANFTKVYVDLRETIFWVPEQLTLALGWDLPGFYPIAVIWVCLVFPLLLLVPALIVYLVGQVRVTDIETRSDPAVSVQDDQQVFGNGGLFGFIGQLALPLLPMVLMSHLVLAIVKFNTKLGYLPLVLQDPSGVKSFLAISVMQTVPAPGVLISLDWLKWLVAAVLIVGFGLSVAAARAIARNRSSQGTSIDIPYLLAALTAVSLILALNGATVYEWLFVR